MSRKNRQIQERCLFLVLNRALKLAFIKNSRKSRGVYNTKKERFFFFLTA